MWVTVIAAIAGFSTALILSYLIMTRAVSRARNESSEKEKSQAALISDLQRELAVAAEKYAHEAREKKQAEILLDENRQKLSDMNVLLSRAEEQKKFLDEKLRTQKEETEKLQQKFMQDFELIAGRILKQNTSEFSGIHLKNLEDTLKPFREKISGFEKLVSDTYEKGIKDQTDLRAELKKLYELNHRISEEAGNLTRALKADVKKQGNWGEMILERILERSGLVKGSEYTIQHAGYNAEGARIQPDVVIHLPDKKHIIIDSKVSLIAYEKWVNADNDELRNKFEKEHVGSLRAHIRGLGEKHYQTARDLNSPDFVLLFIPIESSFSIAVQTDQRLFEEAWDHRIVIVSPSTLLATMLTVSSMWKQENQTRNALEIARQSGALYDKLAGFINDFDKIGKSLDAAQANYHEALTKLSTGKGNLMSRAENIRKLGANATKQIPDKYLPETYTDETEESA